MKTITYEDFDKLDIKVGTVTAVEKVAKSNKLLKLLVDIGDKTSLQILSGISQFYSEDSLMDKQVLVLVNLKPRMLMGFESQGMVLAAVEEDRPVLLSTDQPVKNGCKIS